MIEINVEIPQREIIDSTVTINAKPEITGVTASVDSNTGTPYVTVTETGTGTDYSFNLGFHNLKGEIGDTGNTGNGIASITKTGTSGLIDTYTVTYTDGTTSTFTVTNGAAGINGTDGVGIYSIAKTSTSGLVDTYTITYTDSDTSTFTVTNGKDGTDGINGTNGQDGAAATIAVGTVTTGNAGTNADVTNTGTSSAAVFDFTIPRGDKGDTGATGVSVTGVELISTVGLDNTYRMTFSDGSHFDYVVKDGAAGATQWGGITGTLSNQTDLQSALNSKGSILFATSTTAAATAEKEVSIPSITSLQTGQIIVVQPSETSTVANSTIKLNNFTAYPMKYNGAAITTSTDSIVWGATFPSMFIFDGSNWVFLGHGLDSNTTYTINYMNDAGAITAGTGTYAITRYSLVMQKPNGTWEKVTATNATYSTGTAKSVNTSGFLLANGVKYYTTTTTVAGGSTTSSIQSQSASVDMRYSTNCGATPGWASGDIIYFVGTIGADGLFYLDTTTWWTNTLPNSNDGKIYIQLGQYTDVYKISLMMNNPAFYHDGTGIKQYIPSTGGGGATIDDNTPSTTTVYSSQKTQDLIDALTARIMALEVNINGGNA